MNTETSLETIAPEVIETKVISKNRSYSESLLQLAAFYEQHDDMFLPDPIMTIYGTSTKEDLAICAKAFGSFKKEYDDTFIYLVKQFGDITLKVAEYRAKTCERVVTGTRKVIKTIPVETKTVEVDEEIVEWRCKETSLLGKSNGALQIS